MSPDDLAPELVTGSGDLAFVGGPASGGYQLRDGRPRDLFARITGQPDATKNAYAFVRVDDYDPATFPNLEGTESGDGVALAAYEVTGRLTVPVGAVARLFPLRSTPGYGFVYASPPAPTLRLYALAGVQSVGDGVFIDLGSIGTLPAGTHRLTLKATAGVHADGFFGTGPAFVSVFVISPGPVDVTGIVHVVTTNVAGRLLTDDRTTVDYVTLSSAADLHVWARVFGGTTYTLAYCENILLLAEQIA